MCWTKRQWTLISTAGSLKTWSPPSEGPRKLRYVAEAIRDLADIRHFLSEATSRTVAARMIERLRQRIAIARETPAAGTPRPEYRTTCRFVIERPYVIYYDFDGETLTVLRVLHQARDRDEIMGN